MMTLGSSSSTARMGSVTSGRAIRKARSGSAMALRASVQRPGPGPGLAGDVLVDGRVAEGGGGEALRAASPIARRRTTKPSRW